MKPYEPTEAEIQKQCEEFRSGWGTARMNLYRPTPYTIPAVSIRDIQREAMREREETCQQQ